jgi:hypothetical protein
MHFWERDEADLLERKLGRQLAGHDAQPKLTAVVLPPLMMMPTRSLLPGL